MWFLLAECFHTLKFLFHIFYISYRYNIHLINVHILGTLIFASTKSDWREIIRNSTLHKLHIYPPSIYLYLKCKQKESCGPVCVPVQSSKVMSYKVSQFKVHVTATPVSGHFLLLQSGNLGRIKSHKSNKYIKQTRS